MSHEESCCSVGPLAHEPEYSECYAITFGVILLLAELYSGISDMFVALYSDFASFKERE